MIFKEKEYNITFAFGSFFLKKNLSSSTNVAPHIFIFLANRYSPFCLARWLTRNLGEEDFARTHMGLAAWPSSFGQRRSLSFVKFVILYRRVRTQA